MNCRIIALSFLLFFMSFSCAAAADTRGKPASLPFAFEANQGQAPAHYAYVLRHDGMTILFFASGADIMMPDGEGTEHAIRLSFTGAKPAQLLPADRLSGQSNYFLGADSSRWIEHVPNYGSLLYADLYPGISLDFYGSGNSLEHDFTIAPRADPSLISFQLVGAEEIGLSGTGDLEVRSGASTLILKRPIAYQLQTGRHQPIEAAFRLKKDGSIGFRLGAYDREQPLVIDPVLNFATYLDGSYADQTHAVTTDASGNIYVTGATGSPDFPTLNPEQSQPGCSPSASAGCQTAFVTKLDPTGKSLIYSTFLGGSNGNQGGAIAVDSSGNAIVAGLTGSSDFPVAGNGSLLSCQTNNSCFFLASFSPDGSKLNYSGAFGGEEGFYTLGFGTNLAVDSSGNAYLAGTTENSNFQITPGTLATSVTGYPYDEAFVLKVDPTGKLLYSTVIPGNDTNSNDLIQPYTNDFIPTGIAVDASGDVTIGGTTGLGLPTTANVVSPQFPNASANVENPSAGFVLEINPTASAINYATYVPGTDIVGAMAVDGSGNIYLTGSTSETNLPVSANAYQKAIIPGPDCTCDAGYVLKLNSNGTSILAATYLNAATTLGEGGASFTGIALDSNSNVFLGGETGSADFPMVDPFVTQWWFTDYDAEMILAGLSPDLSTLQFGSFLSATSDPTTAYLGSIFTALAEDSKNNLVVTGQTYSSSFPTTAGSFQPTPPKSPTPQTGYFHSFVASIDMAAQAPSFCVDNWTVNFGQTAANTSTTQTLHVTNCGNAPLTFASITSSDPTITASQNCGSVAPGAVCPVTLTYTPTSDASTNATITFADNTAISPQVVEAQGQGVAASISPSSNPFLLGSLLVGTTGPAAGLLVYNRGNAGLTISTVTISGAGFSVTNNTCTGAVPLGFFCEVDVQFAPTAAGTQNGVLTIDSNDPVNPQLVVALTGTGNSAYGVPSISQVQAQYGTPQQTFQINNGSVKLTLQGSAFYPESVVQLNGVAQSSTFDSNSQLNVTIAASSLTALGEFPLTVTNPSPGGGSSTPITITTYEILPLNPSSLISVPATGLLYAAMPATDPTYPNEVLPIDPTTGKVGTPISVGNNPGLLAASSDGSYLYVANTGDDTVQRINLQKDAVEATFPYPGSPTCSTCIATTDLKSIPGSPQEVVLAIGSIAALYNASGLVNYVPPGFDPYFAPQFDSIAFAGDPLTLYAQPFTTIQNPFFTVVNITSSGLQYTEFTGTNYGPPSGTGSEVVSDGTLLYTDSGEVWNPATQTLVGSFPLSITYDEPGDLILDNTNNQLYAIGEENYNFGGESNSALFINSFGKTSLAAQASLLFSQINSPEAGNLSRWGTNGFAFTVPGIFSDSSGIYLLTSSALTNQQAANPAPTLSSISPTTGTADGPAFTLTVNGAGFLSGSVVDWNGAALATTLVSPTELTAAVPASNIATSGVVAITVYNPTPGGGTSSPATLTIIASAPSAAVAPASLEFGSVPQGTSSSAQPINVTNNGTGSLTIGSIVASGNFTQTNTCGTSLASDVSCQISVVFSPQSTGPLSGTITVTYGAAGSPQTVNLSGTGVAPVTIGVAQGGSTSATISAGQTASYQLSLSAQSGFSGSVLLSCSGAPQYASCVVAPTSVNLTPGVSANLTVSVSTTAPSSAALERNSSLRLAGVGVLSLLLLPLAFNRSRRRFVSLDLWLVIVLVGLGSLALTGCGGGGSTGGQGSQGTPAGNYTLTVTASAGSANVQQPITLVVQ